MIKLIKNEFIKLGLFRILLSIFIFIISSLILYKLDYPKDRIYNFIPFIGIFMSIYFSGTINGEIEEGTFRYYLTKPYKRWKIYLSKLLTIILFMILNSIIILLMYYLLYKDINIIKYIKYLTPLILISGLIIFNSTIINSPSICIGINIFLIIFSILLVQILFGLELNIFEYTFLPYLDFSIFDDINSINLTNIEFNTHLNIKSGIILDLSYFMLFFVGGLLLFNEKDING